MQRAELAAPGMMSDRQWATVRVGAWVVAIALLTNFVVLPFVRGWVEREQQISEARQRVAALAGIVGNRAAVDSLAAARESALALQPTRVLRARSRALAASALQSLVQELADASNVTITRLDVANVESGTGDLPITLSANGDIYGIAALLQNFRHGRQVMVIDKLTVQVNSALRGAPDVLQMTVSLHAPVIVE